MPIERVIQMPPNDYALFQKLQGEVGGLTAPQIVEAQGVSDWYNPDLESSEMAVRAMVRSVTLESLGYHDKGWITEEEDIGKVPDSQPDIESVLGTPDFLHYKWGRVSSKDLGGFSVVGEGVGNKPFVDAQNGVFLFSDEVRQLIKGNMVTTLHSSGFSMGFLTERKEVYSVVDGNLQRIRGLITD
jgi:hypothetical protein